MVFLYLYNQFIYPKIHTHVKFNKRIYTLIIFLTLKHYKTTLTTENWCISLTLTHTFSQLHLKLLQPHKMYSSIHFWASFKTVMGPVINKMFSDRKSAWVAVLSMRIGFADQPTATSQQWRLLEKAGQMMLGLTWDCTAPSSIPVSTMWKSSWARKWNTQTRRNHAESSWRTRMRPSHQHLST